MPFHNNDDTSEDTPISTIMSDNKLLIGGIVLSAVSAGLWYYYKYHYVAFGGKPFFCCDNDECKEDNSETSREFKPHKPDNDIYL